MKISKDFILFTLVITGAAAAGIWVLENNATVTENVQIPEANSVIEQIPQAQNAAPEKELNQEDMTEKQFEDFLNSFLDELQIKMMAYNNKRKIARDLIKPENVRTPEYLQENSKMLQEISAEMNTDMDNIIQTFKQADRDIKDLVNISISGDKDVILQKWETVREKQLETYMAFFIHEKELLTEYRELFNFYFSLGQNLQVDVTNNELIVSDSIKRTQYESILQRIDNIREKNQDLLNNQDQTTVLEKEEIKANSAMPSGTPLSP